MSKILMITTALAALSDAKRHEEAADAVQVGEPSEESGKDDEERLAEDRRAASRRAAEGRAEDAVRQLAGAYPGILDRVAAMPMPAPVPAPAPSAAPPSPELPPAAPSAPDSPAPAPVEPPTS